jgi:isopentenyl diphosphate isomerase/L-lactate dehydrogenase-like FMN-dependent dehydrogenase
MSKRGAIVSDAGSSIGNQPFLTLHEVVKAARPRLSADIWDYLVGAAETETTLRRNRLAIDSLAFRPRVLRDVTTVDPSHGFLGRTLRLPVILAPVGSLESFREGGAATVAAAAGPFGVGQMVSSVTEPGLEATARAAPGYRIFQLYVRGDDAWIDDVVARAVAAGYDAFCLTVDTPVISRRERDLAKRFLKRWAQPPSPFQSALSWKQVARFKARHAIPLIIKGIATAEDAVLCCDHGVDAVYVSNHGGRQLDQGRGSIEVLPEVVEAVAGRARIIVDGGFARGTDVVKAIALGADAVGIGRLYCYGLAAAGTDGVRRVLEILENEISLCLAFLGLTSFAGLNRSYVTAAAPVTVPHVHSAFPLLADGY